MQGEILKRGKSSYQIRIYLGRGEDGKKRYHIETVRGKKRDAENRRAELLIKFSKGGNFDNTKLTVNEYLNSWIVNSLTGSVADRTKFDYERTLDRYVRPRIGDELLIKLQPIQIQQIYTEMRALGLSGRTIRFVHEVLRRAFNQAVKWNVLEKNPIHSVDSPKRTAREMSALTPEQAVAFLNEAKKDRYFAMWLIAIETGMRPEEYFGLQWSDLQDGVLIVQRVVVRKQGLKKQGLEKAAGGSWTFEEPKTTRSRRAIPLSKTALAALEIHKQNQIAERLKAGKNYYDNGLIFCTQIGTPLQVNNLRNRHFQLILKRAGLPKAIRMYDLRHTCATFLLLAKENPRVVQARLGHASVVLTLDTYSHVIHTMQEQATSAIEGLLVKAELEIREKQRLQLTRGDEQNIDRQ